VAASCYCSSPEIRTRQQTASLNRKNKGKRQQLVLGAVVRHYP
jgi:hypothetical protein